MRATETSVTARATATASSRLPPHPTIAGGLGHEPDRRDRHGGDHQMGGGSGRVDLHAGGRIRGDRRHAKPGARFDVATERSTGCARAGTMRAMPSKDECPCRSGRPYKACCGPYHRGDREAPDAEALMRSRFAAFAKKEAEYLWRTLHPDHEDRRHDEAAVLRSIRATASEMRYAGLAILDRREADEDGVAQVLFFARLFQGSAERSFVELSDFAHDGEGWRYLRGTLRGIGALKGDPMALTIAAFAELVARSGR